MSDEEKVVELIKARKWTPGVAAFVADAGGQEYIQGLNAEDKDWCKRQRLVESHAEHDAYEYPPTQEDAFTKGRFDLDSFRSELDVGTGGKISASLRNYQHIFEKDSFLSGLYRKNVLSGKIHVGPTYWNKEEHEISNKDIFETRIYMERVFGLTSKSKTEDAILSAAEDNKFNPVVDYLKSLKWDGNERVADLFPVFLGAQKSELTTHLTELLLRGIISRAFNPGCKYDYCVVLMDVNQGTGKSSMARFLALKDEWFLELKSIDDEKATIERCRGKLVIELEEMLSVRNARDVESIKAFLSTVADDIRLPYERFSTRIPRGYVFIGTSNRHDCLPPDSSGNRRFFPIVCRGENAKFHPLLDENLTRQYIIQCYAEIMATSGDMATWDLKPDEAHIKELEALQASSVPDDPWPGMVEAWLEGRDGPVCSAQVWDEVFTNRFGGRARKSDMMKISDILNNMDGWERLPKKTRVATYGPQRAWVRSAKVEEFHKADGKTPFDVAN